MRTYCSLIIILFMFGCTHADKPVVDNKLEKNPLSIQNQQHVLLISIDGYRHDYTQLHQPKTLTDIANNAAVVTRLKPSYPTKTFPNHYTLVTGLYPQNHGIVSNYFYHPEMDKTYTLGDRSVVTDGQFYQGVPIWSLAASQGVKSATYFWPGSEAKIAGFRPDYWTEYQHHEPFSQRVDQVVEWFSLADEQRPQFVSMYFHEVDSAGHKYGPTSAETQAAINKVDTALADLLAQLKTLPIDINVIITSDHGMTYVDDKAPIFIDEIFNEMPELQSQFTFLGSGPFTHAYVSGPNKQQTIQRFIDESADIEGLEVYQQGHIPTRLNYDNNASIGDLLLKSNSHYLTYSDARPAIGGNHGFDADIIDDMNTILYGYGPAFNKEETINVAQNIHVYPLIAEILGLTINEVIDGDISVLAPLLK